MTLLKHLLLGLAVMCALLACRAGQSEPELIALIDRADAAIAADDMDTLIGISTPDPMMEALLRSQGITSDADIAAARATMQTLLVDMMEQVEIDAHEVDRDAIRYVTADTGAKIAYIPMTMRMTMAGTPLQTTGQYVALERDGEWFLLTPSDATTVTLMKSAFPELADQDIPVNTTGPVPVGDL